MSLPDLFPLFKKHVKASALIKQGDHLIVGVSGGLDSCVLIDLLSRLKEDLFLQIQVAHVNYNMRGRSSLQDAKFTQQIAIEKGFPYHLKTLPRGGLQKGGNFQEQARQVRYRFFEILAKRYRVSKIVVAHQADDQVETFFMRLIRGAGMQGLKGMLPLRPLNPKSPFFLVRPLLPFSRKEIYFYAKKRKLRWREDLSNRRTDYLRNRIRHRLGAEIQQINPQAVTIISKALITLGAEDEWLEKWVIQKMARAVRIFLKKREIHIKYSWLNKQPFIFRYRIYREALRRIEKDYQGIKRSHFDDLEQMVLRGKKSMKITFPQGYAAYLRGDWLVMKKWRRGRSIRQRGFFC